MGKLQNCVKTDKYFTPNNNNKEARQHNTCLQVESIVIIYILTVYDSYERSKTDEEINGRNV